MSRNMVLFRALMLWDHWTSPADKMKALFPDRALPAEQDSWYQEKLGFIADREMSDWIGAFDYPTQKRVLFLAMESYGNSAQEWVRSNEGAP